MIKKYLAYFTLLLAIATVFSCGKKQGKPKELSIPLGHIAIDSIVPFKDGAQCRISVDFTYLKGKQYQAVNDSLLRMGTVQPNYFAISYEPLHPEQAIPELVSRYAAEYIEMAKYIDEREKEYSQLDWALDIKTRIIAGKGDNLVYLSDITIKTGDVTNKYTLANNVDLKTGKRVSLSDEFGNDLKDLTDDILEQIAKNIDTEKDSLKAKGYFVDIDAYPTENFILYDDSVTFIYNSGEINVDETKVTLEL